MNIKERFFLAILDPSDIKGVYKNLKELKTSEFISKPSLEELQKNKMKRLLEMAQKDIPYWSDVIKEDVLSSNLDVQGMLKGLPVLTKQVIRENGNRVYSPKITNFLKARTGGTTGEPLSIRRSYNCNSINKAALHRARLSWGIKPSDRVVFLYAFGVTSLKGRFRMFIANKRMGDAFPSNERATGKISKMLARFQPKAIEGFATGLLESIGRFNIKNKIKIPVIVSTGEMLYPHQRNALENHYSGKVYTYYGSNEIGSIAYECEHQNLHIVEEHVIVETLDDEGNAVIGKPGKVVVTDLDNFAMPFIRYALGDVAVLSDKPCACGRSTKIISELHGRTQDFLSNSKGDKLQATQLAGFLRDLKDVGDLQIKQLGENEITIQFTGRTNEALNEANMIKDHIDNRLGENINTSINQVGEILKTNRGKRPLIVRKV